MLNSTTRKRIDDARDILVGKIPDPKSQVEQITVALIYKFMNDMDSEFEDLGGEAEFFTGEYAEYKWSNIVSKEKSGFEKLNLYAEALEKLSLNNNLPVLFRDIFKNVFLPYRDPETFNLFMKEINGFSYEHSEDLGDAFEYLLSIMSSQGDAGQFRTPRHIIDFIVDVVQPKKNESILDPACGTAGFLISAYKYIVKENEEKGLTPDEKAKLTENIVGYDISPDMVRLSLVNLYLHLFPNPKIFEYDTLTNDTRWNDTFDVILANPPFMTPKGGIRPHDKFSISAKRSEVLFVDYIMEHLNINGRAGVIVPEGIVFQIANAYKNLRKNLVENDYLWAVVSLPAGVFNPYSGVKTSILLLDKNFAKQKDEILFVKLNNDGFDLGAQRREISGSDIPEVIKILKDYQNGLDVLDNALVTISSKKDIARQDYILVGERYKEAVVVNSNYPMVQLGDVCDTTSGGTPKSSIKEYYDNGSINWLKSGDIANRIIYDVNSKITELGLESSSAKMLPVNTVLIAMYGATVGQVGLLKVESTTNQAVCGILPNENIIAEYLYSILKAKRDYLISLSVGGAQPNISQTIIKQIKIPLPPLHIQEEFVTEIERYQKIIDGAKQVVENYKPIINIDQSWESVNLGDVCELNPKKSEVKDISSDVLVSFVPMADINENNMLFVPKEIRKISEVYSGYTYFKNDDVLLAKVTPCFENGKSGLAKDLCNGIGFGSSEFYVLRADHNKVLPEFIYYTINSFKFLIKGKDNMTGTGGLQRLTKDFVLNYPIKLPTIEEQKQIVAQINAEMFIIEQNKRLIEVFEQKINDKISEIWG